MTTLAALVPMRHHSERVPGKNYRPLAGKPLFHYILSTLQACQEITQVVVDTDSPAIMAGLQEHFPHVTAIQRPEELRGDDVSMNEILLYDTTQVRADLYLQTHSTNPLLSSETVSGAIQTLLAAYPAHDSLFSVTRYQKRLWDAQGHPVNHDPKILLRTQDLPPLFEENSCIYIFSRPILERRRNRLGERPLMFEMDAAEAWDIDDELDFLVADALMQRNGGR